MWNSPNTWKYYSWWMHNCTFSYTNGSERKCIVPNYEGRLIKFHSEGTWVIVLPTLAAPNPELHWKNSVWKTEEVSRKLCHLTLALICKKVVFQNRRWGWKSKYSCVFSTQWERRGYSERRRLSPLVHTQSRVLVFHLWLTQKICFIVVKYTQHKM